MENKGKNALRASHIPVVASLYFLLGIVGGMGWPMTALFLVIAGLLLLPWRHIPLLGVLMVVATLIGGLRTTHFRAMITEQEKLAARYISQDIDLHHITFQHIRKETPHELHFDGHLAPPFDQLRITVKTSTGGEVPPLGSILAITGEVTPIESFNDSFPFKEYMNKDLLTIQLRKGSLEAHYQREPHILTPFRDLKNLLQDHIMELWPGTSGEWTAGILLGTKQDLSEELETAFRDTGLAHIVAISGFNITIIILFIHATFRMIPERPRLLIAMGIIILFVLFVGASPPVLRAALMGVLGLLALLSNNKSNVLGTLMMSAAIMCFLSPYVLVYDIGFQLSFLAVLGLLYIDPLIRPHLSRVPERFGIKEALSGTISATIITLPITLYYFEQLSIISPIANILITPAVPFTMLSATLTLLTSFVPAISVPLQLITSSVLHISLELTFLLASVPYAVIPLTLPKEPFLLIGSYLLGGLAIRKWWAYSRTST